MKTDNTPLVLSKHSVLLARRNTFVLMFRGSFEPLWNEREKKEKFHFIYFVYSKTSHCAPCLTSVFDMWDKAFTHQSDLYILRSQLVFL